MKNLTMKLKQVATLTVPVSYILVILAVGVFIFLALDLSVLFLFKEKVSTEAEGIIKSIVYIILIVFAFSIILQQSYSRTRNLKAESRKMEKVFNETDVAIWSVEMPSYKLLHMSPACEKIFGYSQQDFIRDGYLWDKIIHPDDLIYNKKLRQEVYAGNAIKHEYRIIHSSGKVKWVHDRVIPIKDADGRVIEIYGVVIDVTERKETEQKINFIAYHDALTGLPNRKKFEELLQVALNEAKNSNHKLAMMYMDINRFKNINESFGQSFGDHVLCSIAERLKAAMPSDVVVSRIRGDEFIVLCPVIMKKTDIENIAEKALGAFKEPVTVSTFEFHLSLSIGISFFPSDGESSESLIQAANIAMYRAKELNKHNYLFFQTTMKSQVHSKMELESDLRKALENNELHLYYQPQINVESGDFIGVEALIRWYHPVKGIISPAEFIPLAEETGLIVPIGEWVMREACKQNKQWQDAGFKPISVAVNLSTRQFYQANLAGKVKRILEETGLEPKYLDLEITESMTLDVDHALPTIQELKGLGVQISMDDFGTGYSSLNYLKSFPIDRLKIDKSFLERITSDSHDANIVGTIITLAHNLGLRVTAEGVETVDQLQFLKDSRCDETQGFYISRPQPAREIESIIFKMETVVN